MIFSLISKQLKKKKRQGLFCFTEHYSFHFLLLYPSWHPCFSFHKALWSQDRFLITNNAPSFCDTPSHPPAHLKKSHKETHKSNKKENSVTFQHPFFPNSLTITFDVSNKSLLKTQIQSPDSFELPGKPAHSSPPSLKRQLMSLRQTIKSFLLFSNQWIPTKLTKGKNFKLP